MTIGQEQAGPRDRLSKGLSACSRPEESTFSCQAANAVIYYFSEEAVTDGRRARSAMSGEKVATKADRKGNGQEIDPNH